MRKSVKIALAAAAAITVGAAGTAAWAHRDGHGGGHGMHVIDLARGRALPVESRSVPGGDALFLVTGAVRHGVVALAEHDV